jgi:uncharacterized membrane protein YkvI
MREQIEERLLLLVLTAGALAAADLAVKSAVSTPPWDFHQRSQAWVALSLALLVAALLLTRLPSRAVAIAAGVMSGGVLGNLISARWHGNRVPNPLVIGDAAGGIAFNLADVFALVGIVLLTASLCAVAIRHRDRLIPPRRWVARALRRRVRG